MQPGHRFVQQVSLLPFLDLPPRWWPLSVNAMDQVFCVFDQPHRAGFMVATTTHHDEIGEHAAWVRREENGDIWLESASASRFRSYYGK